ncbi:hypothetical protein [Epibacterium ulvae]|uniref:hypothetical protein n=1 Tax=Epibacterium ulvae TaxID=1156985 RepID=UPI00248FFBE6|nr:hypothetical protein [Epibacterium ulvae]
MSFIRPEARAALWRWRELIFAAALVALGLWWAVGSFGILRWIGWAIVCLGVLFSVVAGQRFRFRLGAGGPGLVSVKEGQITYFGPLSGGAIALSEMNSLQLDHTAKPSHWVLEQSGQPPLAIPVNAQGADALFDVFSTLSGLKTERMLTELHSSGDHHVVIWERNPSRAAHHRLH